MGLNHEKIEVENLVTTFLTLSTVHWKKVMDFLSN